MANPAKRKRSFRLPLGGRRDTKPSSETPTAKKTRGEDAAGGLPTGLKFVGDGDANAAEQDFDAILRKVMAAKEDRPSALSTDESEETLAIARRLAERVSRVQGAESRSGKEQSPEAAPQKQSAPLSDVEKLRAVAADAADDQDTDDLAEPKDFQKLMQARQAMTDLPESRPFTEGPIDEPPAVPNLLPLPQDDDGVADRPALKSFDDESLADEVPLKPWPDETVTDAQGEASTATAAMADPLAEATDAVRQAAEKDSSRTFGTPKVKPGASAATEPQLDRRGPETDSGGVDPELLRQLFAARLGTERADAEDASDDGFDDDVKGGGGSGRGSGGGEEPGDQSSADLSLAFGADKPLPEPVKENRWRGLTEALTPAALWLSIAAMISSLVYGVWLGGVDVVVASLLGGGLLVFATILIAAASSKAYSPALLGGFLMKRVQKPHAQAAVLAGNDILKTLGLAETIIDADADARLVTTRHGVVVYANDAYMSIAEEAGIIGATGLPPRIDRLFGQSGTESSKMFRLAKACRSGIPAEEEVTQAMGHATHRAKGELPVRRFLVSVRPMRPSADGQVYAAWRLNELELSRQKDNLKAAFANYPRAVVAVERSGSIAWVNDAASKLFGTKRGQALSLGDVVLGEVDPLVGYLWEPAADEHEVRIRDREQPGSSIDAVFTPFVQGGAGEGFVCVEVMPKASGVRETGSVAAVSDLTDAPFGVAVIEGDPSADGKITYTNGLFKSYFPQASDNARFQSVLSPQAVSELAGALRTRQAQKPLTKPIEVRVGEGAQAHTFRLYARPVRRRRGSYGVRQTVLYAVDITYQRRMEEDHVQGQKLQQIGQIAGSVAHDFNNLLVVVMGSTELLMRNHPVGDPSYKDLSMIYETAQRAQNLTRNLLAFSRKQTLKPEVCSLTELLNDFTPALKRYVSEKVSLEVIHGRHVPAVKADKGQIHLAIMNLAVNARDAMPGGGSLRIETKHVPGADIADYGYEVLDEVDHVLIEVADTGGGVPAEIAEQIFEPFFTTKGEGQGTGLGLSTVAGTIGQMGGRVFLLNRQGEGATFRIFLPAVSEEEVAAANERDRSRNSTANDEEAADPTGTGRILVVEDEDGVRSIVVRALTMCGYEIVEACDGDEALDIIEADAEHFDLVLTDIMMPEMDGPTLIEEAGDKLNGAKVVFMSGYAEAAMREKLNTIEGARYLQKPFTLTSVAGVVKEALAAR